MRRQPNRRLAVLAAAVLAAFVYSAPGLDGQQTAAQRVAEGAAVYGAECGRCHNPRSPLERTDREWVVIANHMRVRANLTGGQVRRVLAFLQATNSDPGRPTGLLAGEAGADAGVLREGPPSTDVEMIALGSNLVTATACIGCHVIGDVGGPVGPSLNGLIKRRDADYIRQKMRDPTFDNSTSMMPNFGLTADEIEALLAYLATLP